MINFVSIEQHWVVYIPQLDKIEIITKINSDNSASKFLMTFILALGFLGSGTYMVGSGSLYPKLNLQPRLATLTNLQNIVMFSQWEHTCSLTV